MREDARHEPFPELLHAHIPERNLSSDSNHRGMTRTSGIRGPQFRGKSLMCGRPLPAIWMRGNGPGSGWRNGRTARRLLRVIAVVGLVLVLLIQLPPPTPGPSSSSPPPSMPFTTFRTDASVAEIQTTGAEPVESYASFAVARGSAGAMALLRSQGHYAEPMVGSSTLQLLGGPIDLAASTMPPMAPWSAVSSEPAVGIVHFHGLIKIEWTQSLESLGLTILRYLPREHDDADVEDPVPTSRGTGSSTSASSCSRGSLRRRSRRGSATRESRPASPLAPGPRSSARLGAATSAGRERESPRISSPR